MGREDYRRFLLTARPLARGEMTKGQPLKRGTFPLSGVLLYLYVFRFMLIYGDMSWLIKQ